MINRKELKALSKEQLKGQWTIVVLITLLFAVINILLARLTSSLESSFLISIGSTVITFLLGLWGNNLYLKLTRGIKVKLSDMFVSGTTFIKGIGIYLLQILIMIPTFIVSILIGTALIVGLAGGLGISDDFILPDNAVSLITYIDSIDYLKFFSVLLLITIIIMIPVLILEAYMYPSLILICEEEDRGVGECIASSFKLMHGNLLKFIVLQLSYLGWILLGILSLGIGYLWLFPYISTVNMNFFNEIVGYSSTGDTTEKLIF